MRNDIEIRLSILLARKVDAVIQIRLYEAVSALFLHASAFARRCKVKEVTKFVSVILMNLRRGGAEVVPVLKQQGAECWEMRKAAAKQMGEEASTKILLPLMIMFVGIILIVATPAVLSFSAGM